MLSSSKTVQVSDGDKYRACLIQTESLPTSSGHIISEPGVKLHCLKCRLNHPHFYDCGNSGTREKQPYFIWIQTEVHRGVTICATTQYQL